MKFPPLSPEEVRERLPEGWTYDEAEPAIRWSHRTRDFAGAFALATRIALLAERMGHHPEITVTWGRLEIALTTHRPRGITRLDLRMAGAIARWKQSNG